MCMQDQCMCVHEILMSTMRNIIINTLWCWSCCGCPVAMYSQSSAVALLLCTAGRHCQGLGSKLLLSPAVSYNQACPPFKGQTHFQAFRLNSAMLAFLSTSGSFIVAHAAGCLPKQDLNSYHPFGGCLEATHLVVCPILLQRLPLPWMAA